MVVLGALNNLGVEPFDFVEDSLKTFGAVGIEFSNPGNFAKEMSVEVRVILTVLGIGSEAGAVGEDGFEPIEILARDVGTLVEDHSGGLLPAGSGAGCASCVCLARKPSSMKIRSAAAVKALDSAGKVAMA